MRERREGFGDGGEEEGREGLVMGGEEEGREGLVGTWRPHPPHLGVEGRQ